MQITIEDQGHGIPANKISKIFDPYYTAKQKGSGPGLSTTHSIIKKHGGLISVQSELNVGKVFNIYLPASDKEVEVLSPTGTPDSLPGCKILIVDDEKDILHVAEKMLESYGHDVKTAEDGALAVELFNKAIRENKPFDLVILDLTIPGGIGGLETLKRLREINPRIPPIVSSGYSNDPVLSNTPKYGFYGYVSKPYLLDELKEAIRSVLS